MKIISSGRAIHSPEFYKKKQKAKRTRLVAVLLIVVVFLTAVIYFLRWQRFLISEIVLAEEIAVDRDEVVDLINKELDGFYFFIIPKRNAFVYQKGEIEQRLLEEFPRFKSVGLNLDNFQKLYMTASEYEPFALYCRGRECFFIDESGFIFAQAPSFSEGVYFEYTSEASIEGPLGKSYMPSLEFAKLNKFLKALAEINVNPLTFQSGEYDYRIFLREGGQIIWKNDTDLSLVYSNLEAFLASEAIKSQPNFLERISTLDLRTENKVFYKFK